MPFKEDERQFGAAARRLAMLAVHRGYHAIAIGSGFEASENCHHRGPGLRHVSHGDYVDSGCANGIIVATGIDRVSHEQHSRLRNAGFLGKTAHSISLVDALASDVDGG